MKQIGISSSYVCPIVPVLKLDICYSPTSTTTMLHFTKNSRFLSQNKLPDELRDE